MPIILASVIVGCGRDDGGASAEPSTRAGTPTKNAAPPARTPRTARGRELVMQTGCFACHQVGRAGHDGPGPELSSIGERMPASAIARSLVAPTRPMPSYRELPEADRRAIVAYLVTLRGPDRGPRSKRIRGKNIRER